MKERVRQVLYCLAPFFAPRFNKKYDMISYTDISKPVLFHGIRSDRHYRLFKAHKGKIIVLWLGGGLSKYTTPQKVAILKSRPDAKHIAHSICIQKQLAELGIESEVLPIIGELPNIKPYPLGDKIYGYRLNTEFYGRNIHTRIERETGLEIIYTSATGNKTFNDDELREIYKQCFIGVRLTPYDGLGSTSVELGLMGRRCIFNGDPPNCIKWKTEDDVMDSILKEYENRNNADYMTVAKSVKDYFDVGDEWMNI